MKKIISVTLVAILLLGVLPFSAFAAGGDSISLPLIYEAGSTALKYTAAFACNCGQKDAQGNDIHAPVIINGQLPDPNPASDGTYEPAYIVYYDMSKYGTPSSQGEVLAVGEEEFIFSLNISGRYEQKVVVKVNNRVVEPNAAGNYVFKLQNSNVIEIPDTVTNEQTGATLPNFRTRHINMYYPTVGKEDGYNLYGGNTKPTNQLIREANGEIPAMYGINETEAKKREQAYFGTDYYVYLMVNEGYRGCLSNSTTQLTEGIDLGILSGINLMASYIPGAEFPGPDFLIEGFITPVADLYEVRQNGYFYRAVDYYTLEKRVSESGTMTYTDKVFVDEETHARVAAGVSAGEYKLAGIIYQIKGEAFAYKYHAAGPGFAIYRPIESLELSVMGIREDSQNTLFERIRRIIRLIISFFQNLSNEGVSIFSMLGLGG